jgi:mRNA-degrading endonuclease RelE of RelBE toxin-antitoxin system
MTRHAKNYLRRLEGSIEDVERVIGEPLDFDRDRRGKPRYTGRIRGVRVRVVVALDEPDLIVTIHDRRN